MLPAQSAVGRDPNGVDGRPGNQRRQQPCAQRDKRDREERRDPRRKQIVPEPGERAALEQGRRRLGLGIGADERDGAIHQRSFNAVDAL